jgi:hypothetical protein
VPAFASARRDDGKTPASCKMEMFSETVARAGSRDRGELQEIINIFMPMGCHGLFLGAAVPSSAPAMQQISRRKLALGFHPVKSIFKQLI